MSILIAGVGELYQGDLDLGRRAADQLASEITSPDVHVEDVHYGAIAFAQMLEDVRPEALILVGACRRGDGPGEVRRRRLRTLDLDEAAARIAIESAGTGYVSLDLAVEVAWALHVLPVRTIVVEAEPAATDPSETLSPIGESALQRCLYVVRTELRRIPLFLLADRLREELASGRLDPAEALESLERLLLDLDAVEETGRWGATFRTRDRLRERIAGGATPQGMQHLDWGLWWTLIEELERIQRVEAIAG